MSPLGTGAGIQLYGKPIQFNPKTSLSTSLTASHDLGGMQAGSMVYGNAGLNRSLGTLGMVALNYSYTWAQSMLTPTTTTAGITGLYGQRVSADISLSPSRRFSTHLSATRGIGDGNTSAFGDLSYAVNPLWRIHLLGTYQMFTGLSYSDAELALARKIGNQEASLVWSQAIHRFRFQFLAMSFERSTI